MGTETLYFNCPHCSQPIDLTVKADTRDLDDYDDDGEELGDFYYEGGGSRRWPDRSEVPYLATMDKIINGPGSGYDREAVPWIKAHIDTIPGFLETDEGHGLSRFYVLEGRPTLRLLACLGERALLEQLLEMAKMIPAMAHLSGDVEAHINEMGLFEDIRVAVAENPGCEQPRVKEFISEVDGRLVANLIAFMDTVGVVERTRKGKKIFVFPATD